MGQELLASTLLLQPAMLSPKLFLEHITRTRTGTVGAVLTSVSAVVFLALIAATFLGFETSPYIGILGFLVVPFFFVVGLILIPIGLSLERRRRRSAGETGPPVIDLGSPVTKRKIRIFIIATIINVVIIVVAMLKGIEVMGTNEFCGQTCHKVMQPEYTSYQRSAHSRVHCVQCHIGPGTSWFVKSKLSGSWQVISVAFNLYPRPIKTPIHNLRPARETCEQCHWPEKFVGDRLKVLRRFQEDEPNTELKTVMMLKVGGRRANESNGIHWHVDPRHSVRYRSDPSREDIYEIEELVEGKTVKRFLGPKAETPESKQVTSWRTMDCVDCHNRPAHVYLPAQEELDRAFADQRLDRTIPFLRREGLKALKTEYATHEAARVGIEQQLIDFYGKSYPAIAQERVRNAAKVLGDAYTSNVFPQMKVTWGTYKNQLGHAVDNGCMRCHDGEHKAADGAPITADCDTCHTILADSEAEPDILKTLQP